MKKYYLVCIPLIALFKVGSHNAQIDYCANSSKYTYVKKWQDSVFGHLRLNNTIYIC